MINLKKIYKLLLVTAFFCTFIEVGNSFAVVTQRCPVGYVYTGGKCVRMHSDGSYDYKDTKPAVREESESNRSIHNDANLQTLEERCPSGQVWSVEKKTCVPVPVVATNIDHKGSKVNGCSSNTGLFSSLITSGRSIFTGLRDLIYVVAGFGIIGVAVGGFFGNLNWKWLGAIVIGLVVIASTGELINAITGCENFTQAMITDTLK